MNERRARASFLRHRPVVDKHILNIFCPCASVDGGPAVDDNRVNDDAPVNLREASSSEEVLHGVEEDDRENA